MNTDVENMDYRYRAPLRYLFFFVGFLCAGALASFFFASVEQWIFRAIILFIMAVSFGGAVAFLISYLRGLSGRISFMQDSIALPVREHVVLKYSGISKVEEIHTPNRILKITTLHGRIYLLDESRMCKGKFDAVAQALRERTGAKR